MEHNNNSILLARPHGSLNMMVNEKEGYFAFGYASTWGGGTHAGNASLCASILPPRLNKNYRDNPIASSIINAASGFRPDTLTFWGLGFTESDIDLNKLYQTLAGNARTIELINPDSSIVPRLEQIVCRKVTHFPNVEKWLSASCQ
jgi:hypothetical protein